jgi:hypothetical protein
LKSQLSRESAPVGKQHVDDGLRTISDFSIGLRFRELNHPDVILGNENEIPVPNVDGNDRIVVIEQFFGVLRPNSVASRRLQEHLSVERRSANHHQPNVLPDFLDPVLVHGCR